MPGPVFEHDRDMLNERSTLDEGEIRACHAAADTSNRLVVLFGPWRLIGYFFPMQYLAARNQNRSGWVTAHRYDNVEIYIPRWRPW